VKGPRVFPDQVTDFLYDLPFSRYRRAKSPLISGSARNFLYFSCRYSVGSSDMDFVFGGLVGLMEALHQE